MADQGNETLMLILLWLFWPVGLIWYLVDEKMRKKKWVKYQFKQWLGAVVATVLLYVISIILMIVLIGFVLIFVVWALALVWLVQGIIFAVHRSEKPLWLIGEHVEKLFTF